MQLLNNPQVSIISIILQHLYNTSHKRVQTLFTGHAQQWQ